jgi:hypothetical protein
MVMPALADATRRPPRCLPSATTPDPDHCLEDMRFGACHVDDRRVGIGAFFERLRSRLTHFATRSPLLAPCNTGDATHRSMSPELVSFFKRLWRSVGWLGTLPPQPATLAFGHARQERENGPVTRVFRVFYFVSELPNRRSRGGNPAKSLRPHPRIFPFRRDCRCSHPFAISTATWG